MDFGFPYIQMPSETFVKPGDLHVRYYLTGSFVITDVHLC